MKLKRRVRCGVCALAMTTICAISLTDAASLRTNSANAAEIKVDVITTTDQDALNHVCLLYYEIEAARVDGDDIYCGDTKAGIIRTNADGDQEAFFSDLPEQKRPETSSGGSESESKGPDTSSGISTLGAIQKCITEYNGIGASFDANGNILCGTEVIGGYYTGSEQQDEDEPEHLKILWNLASVCKKYQSDSKFTFEPNGSVSCGNANIASWAESGNDVSVQIYPDTGGGTTSPGSNTSTGGSTISSEMRQLINQLQTLIDQIKNDPIFKHYQRLIEAVKAAEDLLAKINGSATTSRIVVPEQKPDQPYMAYAMVARQANAVLATSSQQDLTDAIKEIGDAMRELGIKTDLGQSSKVPTVEDLQAAIKAAKNVEKYQEYVSLIQTLEAAELAISRRSVSATTIANLQNSLADTKKSNSITNTTGAPNTGISGQNSDSTTASTAKVLMAISVIAAAIGASVVAYRQTMRKETAKRKK